MMKIGARRFLLEHSILLSGSYKRLTGHDLAEPGLTADALAQALFDAPFALVSHGTEPDPIFNYGNRTALALFETTWVEFTRLPSRLSAEPVHRDERQRLMEEVTRSGFIADYQGVRISRTGRRFDIEQAIVWNLIDDESNLRGQAAMFASWQFLASSSVEASR